MVALSWTWAPKPMAIEFSTAESVVLANEPIKMLLFPVINPDPTPSPNAILFDPVFKLKRGSDPIPTFVLPVVKCAKGREPIPVLA